MYYKRLCPFQKSTDYQEICITGKLSRPIYVYKKVKPIPDVTPQPSPISPGGDIKTLDELIPGMKRIACNFWAGYHCSLDPLLSSKK